MNLLHGIVLALLCTVILFNVKLTNVKTVPASIILLFVVFYLFTQSPLLGVVGMIAAYQLMPLKKGYKYVDGSPSYYQETLEEQIVKKIVPLVHSQSPPHLNFKYNNDNIHNAAPLL